jgi:exocyst complex component 6
LSNDVKYINAHGVSILAQDVQYLIRFVDSLENGPMLRQNLDELQQTVDLMQAENSEEFFDISIRNKKYGRVDALNGPLLLEKYAIICSLLPQRTDTYQAYCRV